MKSLRSPAVWIRSCPRVTRLAWTPQPICSEATAGARGSMVTPSPSSMGCPSVIPTAKNSTRSSGPCIKPSAGTTRPPRSTGSPSRTDLFDSSRRAGKPIAFRLLLFMALFATDRAAFAADPSPLDRYAALPADSTDARQAVISEDVKAFRIDVDQALAGAGKNDPRWSTVFPGAAADYLSVTGDSLLVSDVAFAKRSNAAQRKKWYEATGWDETASGFTSSDPKKAATLFGRAAEAYRGVKHLRREAVAWGSLGVSCWNAREFDCALDAYHRALLARRRLGDALLIGRTLNGLGSVHFQLGEYDSALVYYQDAKTVRERLGRETDLGTTLAYMGNVYYRLGNLGAARSRYLEALGHLGENGPQKPISEART